ncbi:MAG: hypothetical protein IKJ05_00320 [Oscillospiraceae bacterium]|nr:hypothetical protein [Oscillospiraceae bacterium]
MATETVRLFYTFDSQRQRRDFGGSAFIEIQYCRLPAKTDIREIVSVDSILNWLDDSLYVPDENRFYTRYSNIFTGGVYNNLHTGPVDVYGINYYSPEHVYAIIESLKKTQPADYEILLDWLKKAEAFNGIYILGL